MNKVKQWRKDQDAAWIALAEKYRLPTPKAKSKQALDKLEAGLREILANGLDIGGIVECTVPVVLEKHPRHGWVFVCVDGEMHIASTVLARHKSKK